MGDRASSLSVELDKSRAALVGSVRARLHEAHIIEDSQLDARLQQLHELSSRAYSLVFEIKSQAEEGVLPKVTYVVNRISKIFGFKITSGQAQDAESGPVEDAESAPVDEAVIESSTEGGAEELHETGAGEKGSAA